LVRDDDVQSQSWKSTSTTETSAARNGAVAKWSVSISIVKRIETGMQYTGSSYREYDIKTLQEDVNDKKPS